MCSLRKKIQICQTRINILIDIYVGNGNRYLSLTYLSRAVCGLEALWTRLCWGKTGQNNGAKWENTVNSINHLCFFWNKQISSFFLLCHYCPPLACSVHRMSFTCQCYLWYDRVFSLKYLVLPQVPLLWECRKLGSLSRWL